MKLYRYIPALDQKDETKLYSGMLENLQNAILRFVHPASLNDPLEAIIPYQFKENGEIVNPDLEKIKNIVQEASGIKDWNSPRGKRILETMSFGITLEYSLMLSMSKAKDHQLMWAHYANQHKGICFEFNFPDNSDDFLKEVKWSVDIPDDKFGLYPVAGEVNYEHQRAPIIFEDGKTTNDYNICDALLSKPKCWEYEQEYRILLCYPWDSECRFGAGINTRGYFFEYPKEWLTGITFGMRLQDSFREEIAACARDAGYQNVKWREEKLKNDKFEITSEAITI